MLLTSTHRRPLGQRPEEFTLIADDFAMTPAVSASILELAGAGRLSGTGAMTNRPHWPSLARDLDRVSSGLQVGLHFNLTLGEPLGDMPHLAPGGELPSFGRLMQAAFTGRLDSAEIEAQALRQIDAFAAGLGRLPDFIDGHQHVHVLPGVRGAILSAISARYGDAKPWVRNPFDTPGTVIARGVAVQKALVISAISTGFGRGLRARGISSNEGFSGISPFDPRRDFADDFVQFLRAPGPSHLVMCHPGFVDAELERIETVVATRPVEHEFLAGARFLEVVEQSGLVLARPDANAS